MKLQDIDRKGVWVIPNTEKEREHVRKILLAAKSFSIFDNGDFKSHPCIFMWASLSGNHIVYYTEHNAIDDAPHISASDFITSNTQA